MSINNMSYDIVYYSRCCDLDTAGRQRTIVRFFTRAPSCGSGGSRAVTHAATQLRTIVKSDPDLEKGTSAAASEQFLIQAQKKATRRLPFLLPANGIT